MANAVALSIAIATDTSDAVTGFDQVASSAENMGREVDRAADVANSASSRLDNVASSAENMDDKAGKATGALGALSAGFELAGMEEYAGGLQAAAMATDFFSGVGQAASLIMETQWVMRVKDTAATVAHTVASTASAVATGVMTAAQWALNAALSANPIGVVIISILALIAVFVLLYKKNEAFRTLVQAVFTVVKTYVMIAVTAVKTLASFITDVVIPAFVAVGRKGVEVWGAIVAKVQEIAAAIVARIQAMREALTEKWTALKDAGRAVWDAISEKVAAVKSGIESAITTLRDNVVGYLQAMLAPIQTVIDKVQELIGWVKNLDFPDLPGWVPGAGIMAGVSAGSSSGFVGGPAGSQSLTVNVQGFVGDESALAREIERVLTRRADRMAT